jgi:hypothetical protein
MELKDIEWKRLSVLTVIKWLIRGMERGGILKIVN